MPEIAPPPILTWARIDEGVALLDRAIADVEAGPVNGEVVAQCAGW